MLGVFGVPQVVETATLMHEWDVGEGHHVAETAPLIQERDHWGRHHVAETAPLIHNWGI